MGHLFCLLTPRFISMISPPILHAILHDARGHGGGLAPRQTSAVGGVAIINIITPESSLRLSEEILCGTGVWLRMDWLTSGSGSRVSGAGL